MAVCGRDAEPLMKTQSPVLHQHFFGSLLSVERFQRKHLDWKTDDLSCESAAAGTKHLTVEEPGEVEVNRGRKHSSPQMLFRPARPCLPSGTIDFLSGPKGPDERPGTT